jgi:hypothetical protein
MDSGFRRNDGFWTFDESIKYGSRLFPAIRRQSQRSDNTGRRKPVRRSFNAQNAVTPHGGI